MLRTVALTEPVKTREHGDRQRNGQKVGHEQEEGAARDLEFARGKTEPGDGKRRHQGGGDRNTDDRLTLAVNDGVAARKTGKDRNEQVKEVWPCARKNFGRNLRERRNEDDHESGGKGHGGTDGKRDNSLPERGKIEDGEREAHQHDRAHQGRDQHRADDDGRR